MCSVVMMATLKECVSSPAIFSSTSELAHTGILSTTSLSNAGSHLSPLKASSQTGRRSTAASGVSTTSVRSRPPGQRCSALSSVDSSLRSTASRTQRSGATSSTIVKRHAAKTTLAGGSPPSASGRIRGSGKVVASRRPSLRSQNMHLSVCNLSSRLVVGALHAWTSSYRSGYGGISSHQK